MLEIGFELALFFYSHQLSVISKQLWNKSLRFLPLRKLGSFVQKRIQRVDGRSQKVGICLFCFFFSHRFTQMSTDFLTGFIGFVFAVPMGRDFAALSEGRRLEVRNWYFSCFMCFLTQINTDFWDFFGFVPVFFFSFLCGRGCPNWGVLYHTIRGKAIYFTMKNMKGMKVFLLF